MKEIVEKDIEVAFYDIDVLDFLFVSWVIVSMCLTALVAMMSLI